jgi:membrane-associated PAP2 superfamily phosphatase
MSRWPRQQRRDAGWLLAGLLALVAWEWSGGDLALAGWYGNPTGFAWRDAWMTSTVLHNGGRWLAWAVMAALVWDASRAARNGPPRRERLYWLAATVAGLVLVPTLKRFTSTSCPWDLAPFGGTVPYVPHWALRLADGGPGHCFPSGHAVAAFAFFSVYFLWRSHRPGLARGALAAVCLLGGVFGWAQMARGAHFLSHTLWSAWCCWAICSGAAWGWALRGDRGLEQRLAGYSERHLERAKGIEPSS